jgi:hypothetical protein
MKEMMEFLISTPWPISLMILCFISFIMVLINIDKLLLLFKAKKVDKDDDRCIVDIAKILLDFSARSKIYEYKVKKVTDSILVEQMNFAEQKLSEIKFKTLNLYQKQLKLINNDLVDVSEFDLVEYNKQFVIYKETLSNAINLMKDEIRRSMIENGFTSKSKYEFEDYIKNQHGILITIGKNYTMLSYPYIGMDIKMDDFKGLESVDVEEFISDIYVKAREIKKRSDEKIEDLNKNFEDEMNEFIKTKEEELKK